MKKEEVEEILILIKCGEQEALNMKIYKAGIITRGGCGGIPAIGISGWHDTGSSFLFDSLIKHIPQEVLDRPLMYEETDIKTPMEYLIAFYGVSSNGDHGE